MRSGPGVLLFGTQGTGNMLFLLLDTPGVSELGATSIAPVCFFVRNDYYFYNENKNIKPTTYSRENHLTSVRGMWLLLSGGVTVSVYSLDLLALFGSLPCRPHHPCLAGPSMPAGRQSQGRRV